MRGQDSGSEHDYDGGTAAPPPSFGQPFGDPSQPIVPSSPWRPGYSWFSAPGRDSSQDHPDLPADRATQGQADSSALPAQGENVVPPVVPGAPPWQPPPAFTAAAAGMQVWPASDAPGRAWPAATGESIGEPSGWPQPPAVYPAPVPGDHDAAESADQAPDRPSPESDSGGFAFAAVGAPEPPVGESAAAQAVLARGRSGEPGDVPVWPPRLPGEPEISAEGEEDPPVVPRHWPPNDPDAAPALRPWSAPAHPATADAELPDPEPGIPTWPSVVGAHAASDTATDDEPRPGEPNDLPVAGLADAPPSVAPEADVPPPAQPADDEASPRDTFPPTHFGAFTEPETPAEPDTTTPDAPGPEDAAPATADAQPEAGTTESADDPAPEGTKTGEADTDEGDLVTLPGERAPEGLPWQRADWSAEPPQWPPTTPLPPLPDDETPAETTIPRREAIFPAGLPMPARAQARTDTPAEGIVLPPVQQSHRNQLPAPVKPATLLANPRQRSRSGAGRKAVFGLCSLIVVGAIGTAAYFAYTDQGTRATAAPAPSATPMLPNEGPDPGPVAAAVLDSEATDPRKLTLAEAFPDGRVSVDGRTFRRVKVNITDNCEDAAAGAFAQALTQHQCRRVLRATYVDGKQKYAITTGIAVLPTKEAALEVDKAKNLGGNLWFRGLNGDADTGADRVAISGGYAAGMVWGRYIVFSYATYADGHTPVENEKDLGPVSGAFRDHTAEVVKKRITQ
ncbi:hypothetical protein [Acrocarpospora catenulata]|uniref:hypothetical protein n=1 Tax=Acrocarpospora catenulata TaxID=2836182 RepID=UPI001BDAEC62|nr:hypothetical protein [Acrocarpospora catenulata]